MYNFDLDMASDNSCSIILKQIKPNSKVLELGPAFGRMTKYLKEVLNCNVSIIEKDYYSGLVAKDYSNNYIIGDNADLDVCPDEFQSIGKDFDYVIAADVLEHLINPDKALMFAKSVLKKDGKMLISIPNVAHSSVIIDLWNNKFNYKDTGLLDRTHLRFYTRNSLLELITKNGFELELETNTRCAIQHTEFKNNLSDIPYDVAKYLVNREFYDTYQFVWRLNVT